MFYRRITLCLFLLLCTSSGFAQQVPDTSFQVNILKKSYPNNDGPVIAIDEAHHNFHTLEGKYKAFAWILKQDGYRLRAHKTRISKKSLEELDILVIVNAIHKSNAQNWSLPTPSAFTDKEIAALETWVRNGGRLFLIADHMPFPGAVSRLASRFGFEMTNSFAFDNRRRNIEFFLPSNGTLKESQLTDGEAPFYQKIDTVVTFMGQGFYIPEEAIPILALPATYTLAIPKVAWQFGEEDRYISAEGSYQLAYRTFGKGKLVVSGEAAMFSAQLANGQFQMGLNHPAARQNIPLLLNLIRWLGE